MKTNVEIINNVLLKTKKLRKQHHIKTAVTSVILSGLLLFLVSFSNILPVQADFFANSYKNYLTPYATTQPSVQLTAGADDTNNNAVPEATLRFIDENNAVVSVGERAYPCLIQAKSKTKFKLTPANNGDGESDTTDTPNVFHVEFWESNATLSWNIAGIKIEKVLSVAQEKDIPTGLWVTYARQSGQSAPTVSGGIGWTLILDNGKSYSGEGRDAYISKFLSVNNILLQCFFDSKSGLILDASVCTYDTTTFDIPTLKESFLSDGDEYYFYSRLLTDEEKLQYDGGTFTAAGVTYTAEDFAISKKELIHESMAKWQLLPNSSIENHLLDLTAKLDLSANGTALLTVTGDIARNTKTKGKWYALQDSILVVLNENTNLLGRIFTVYANNAQDEKHPTADELTKSATTSLYTYDFYKVGYHVFQYRATEEETQIYWGNDWKKEYILADVVYEKTYVLYGKYLHAFYNDPNFDKYRDDPNLDTTLTPLPLNGKLEIVFHEDGTATFSNTETGETWVESFLLPSGHNGVRFPNKTLLYQGERIGRHRDYSIKLSELDPNCGYLDAEGIIYVTATNDGIHHYTARSYTYVYVSLVLKP